MTPDSDLDAKLMHLIDMLREGLPMKRCAELSGLSMAEVNAMRKIPEVERAIVSASTEKERAVLSSLLLAAVQGNTDAARWYLERRSPDYMSINQRLSAKLAEARWRMEKRIIRAELDADPHRTAQSANRKLEAMSNDLEEDEEEGEILAIGGQGEEG